MSSVNTTNSSVEMRSIVTAMTQHGVNAQAQKQIRMWVMELQDMGVSDKSISETVVRAIVARKKLSQLEADLMQIAGM